jgi:hypothetical protein
MVAHNHFQAWLSIDEVAVKRFIAIGQEVHDDPDLPRARSCRAHRRTQPVRARQRRAISACPATAPAQRAGIAVAEHRRTLMRHREFSRQHPRTVMRVQAKSVVSAAIAAVTAAAATVLMTAGPSAAALPTWPANPNWQALVPAPSSDDVRPVSIVRTQD